MNVRPLVAALLAIWTATLAGGLLAVTGISRFDGREPHDALRADGATLIALLSQNALVALWPLALVALGWPSLPAVRRLGDAVIAAQLIGHGLLVGAQLGQHPDTWRYLPHLPFEWLALALAPASWIDARTHGGPHRRVVEPGRLIPVAGACLASLLAAAAIETYLVPIG